jgi:hypothetical protein
VGWLSFLFVQYIFFCVLVSGSTINILYIQHCKQNRVNFSSWLLTFFSRRHWFCDSLRLLFGFERPDRHSLKTLLNTTEKIQRIWLWLFREPTEYPIERWRKLIAKLFKYVSIATRHKTSSSTSTCKFVLHFSRVDLNYGQFWWHCPFKEIL